MAQAAFVFIVVRWIVSMVVFQLGCSFSLPGQMKNSVITGTIKAGFSFNVRGGHVQRHGKLPVTLSFSYESVNFRKL